MSNSDIDLGSTGSTWILSFLNFKIFYTLYYKNIKEMWEENTCPCCLYKKLYFEVVEIGFIYFPILFFTCLYIICIFHIFLIIIVLVTYLNELWYTIISLTIMLLWTSLLKKLFFLLLIISLKWIPRSGVTGWRQMNIFMVLDFYCQTAFQRGCVDLQGQGSPFLFRVCF